MQTKHHRITILPACIRHRVRVGAKYVVEKKNGKLRLVEEVEGEREKSQSTKETERGQ